MVTDSAAIGGVAQASLLAAAFVESPVATLRTAVDDGRVGCIFEANAAAHHLLGSSELTGRRLSDLAVVGSVLEVGDRPTQHLLTVPVHPDASTVHAGDPVRWLEATVAPLTPAASPGQPAALVLLFDVTERRALDRRLDQAMRQDPLTGLANRDELMRRLSALEVVTDGPNVGLLFLDLDRFKRVNDYRGHASGDEVLMAVAGRLGTVVRPEDLVARVGGDEFVVLCPRLAAPADAHAIAERVRRALDQPLEIGGRGLRVTMSVGVATAPVGSVIPATLLHAADVAMYGAKQAGRNQVAIDPAGPAVVPGRRLPAFRRAVRRRSS